ncbi:aminotransferase class V-fold PLP-dependent enzyme [Nocardioides luteus]|uniref:aminotransferase class V-fold PLP-dependent enzyme n=1 Tax=Nocardioides luteus TaxID=1844 RepID=UPI0018CB4FE1|nr:aminotransferase class V-fold PLP-dependent enzyme [Nocardioides luteus]MBG6096676.1 cysteine desulfurase/selenocysteine lyase [Nocardioides luteus]
MLGSRRHFPALTAEPDLVYLDAASGTPCPEPVIAQLTAELRGPAANPGRGGHPWARDALRRVEEARAAVAAFLGAAFPDEVAFTRGATGAMAFLADRWGPAALEKGGDILYCPGDHLSTVRPWLRLAERMRPQGVRAVPYRRDRLGRIDADDFARAAGDRTAVVVATDVHNLHGTRTDLDALAIPPAATVCLDCSQSAGRLPLRLAESRAEVAVVSGHKMFGPPGTGTVYVRRGQHHRIAVDRAAGRSGPARHVSPLTDAAEEGSLDGAGAAALAGATAFLDGIGVDRVGGHLAALASRFADGATRIGGVTLLGPPVDPRQPHSGIVAFALDGQAGADVAFALERRRVYVRAGDHCLDGPRDDAVRASFHLYNDENDVDRLLQGLSAAAERT